MIEFTKKKWQSNANTFPTFALNCTYLQNAQTWQNRKYALIWIKRGQLHTHEMFSCSDTRNIR